MSAIVDITIRYILINGHIVEVHSKARKSLIDEVLNDTLTALEKETFIKDGKTLIRCNQVASVDIVEHDSMM